MNFDPRASSDAARIVVACGGVSDEDVALEAALDALNEKEVKP